MQESSCEREQRGGIGNGEQGCGGGEQIYPMSRLYASAHTDARAGQQPSQALLLPAARSSAASGLTGYLLAQQSCFQGSKLQEERGCHLSNCILEPRVALQAPRRAQGPEAPAFHLG